MEMKKYSVVLVCDDEPNTIAKNFSNRLDVATKLAKRLVDENKNDYPDSYAIIYECQSDGYCPPVKDIRRDYYGDWFTHESYGLYDFDRLTNIWFSAIHSSFCKRYE